MSRHTPRSRDERTATPLSADDARPLVDDPALPGVHKVLSRAGLQDWLSDALDQPCIVTPRRLRYKAGTSAVLGFDLTTVRDGVVVTEACLARAYADHAAAKIEKLSEKVPADACLARDDALRAVVTTAAGDRALPLLPALGRPDGAARLLDRLFPETSAPAQTRLHTVRHNPGRRWVGVLERDDAKPLLLRA
ncbi:MAG: hypothetical protein HOQ22_00355, partial [Nocardioidaceae bacterium]|nr:hypothetical protein [Nocardioidaceae bacterium]